MVVVGGGPGGLSAALVLARARRRVLVVDDGTPRNRRAAGVHSYLGLHGVPPMTLRARGRREVRRFGGAFLDGRVTGARRLPGGAFALRVAPLRRKADDVSVRCRRVVLASGVQDRLPPWRALDRFFGRTVLHCSDCDGWEVRGLRVAVSGGAADAVALKMLAWTSRVVLVTDRALGARRRRELDAARIRVVRGRVAACEGRGARLAALRLEDGRRVACDAAFFALGADLRPGPHEALGCALDRATGLVRVDDQGRTSVPGVFAVGDMSGGSQMAIVAASKGVLAGIAVHADLLRAAAPRNRTAPALAREGRRDPRRRGD